MDVRVRSARNVSANSRGVTRDHIIHPRELPCSYWLGTAQWAARNLSHTLEDNAVRLCPECSNEVPADRPPTAIYCSATCAFRVRQAATRRRKRATAKNIQRFCVICSAPVASDGNRICCSAACSQKRYRQRENAYREQLRERRKQAKRSRNRVGSCPERARRIVELLMDGGGWERLYRSRQAERAELVNASNP